MKRIIVLLLPAFLAAGFAQRVSAQTEVSKQQTVPATRQIAKEGDKVWVIVNHIKADKRQQFEHFINDVFWPMASKLSTEDQRLFRLTRVLHPTQAEADGTYSNLFIMDPLVEGGDYDIARLLNKMYGEEKGAEYNRLFDETTARDQTQYLMVQSRY